MKLPITLTDLFIKKMNIENDYDLASSTSGTLIIEAFAAYGDIVKATNDKCIVHHNLTLKMRGVSEGSEDPLFTVSVEATGKFTASVADVENARNDQETQTCVSSMIADSMFLGMRAYMDQSFSMMGLKNVQIPWSFKLEQPAILESK